MPNSFFHGQLLPFFLALALLPTIAFVWTTKPCYGSCMRPRSGHSISFVGHRKMGVTALTKTKTRTVEVSRNVQVQTNSTRNNRWETMVSRLHEFRERYGHSLVSQSHDDQDLYFWTKQIRKNYLHQVRNNSSMRLPRLSACRLRTLEELEFCWELQSTKWDILYNELCSFKEKNDHCRVSTRENRKLGIFVQNQRREYRRLLAGNRTTLTSERIQKLTDIGFEWYRSHDVAWKERFDDLLEFYHGHGHCNVPEDYEDNFQLGQWCMNQRTAYRFFKEGKPTGLTLERIRKLEAINFTWKYRESRWENMYERLKQYQQVHGHIKIATCETEENDLRKWLIYQRYFYKRRSTDNQTVPITPERIEALESIPEFTWRAQRKTGPSKADWSQLFGAIRERGIAPGARAKQHIFEGMDRFETEVKNVWTTEDLIELWNQEDDDEYD